MMARRQVVRSPFPSEVHEQASHRLARVLRFSLPGAFVVEAALVRILPGQHRVPDVSVVRDEAAPVAHIREVRWPSWRSRSRTAASRM